MKKTAMIIFRILVSILLIFAVVFAVSKLIPEAKPTKNQMISFYK